MELAIWALVASGVVLTLVFCTMRLLRHLMGRSMGSGRLEVIEAVPVGRGVQLVLVRVAREHLVLGVSDSRVTRIAEVNADCITGEVDAVRGQEQASGSFLDTLRQVIGRPGGS